MIRSALSKKASAVPLPGSTDPWAAPTEWAHVAPSSDGQLSSGPSEVSLPSSVDTYTTTSSSSSKARRTVAFGSVAAFGASVASVDSAGSRSTVRLAGAAPFGQGQQGAVVFQIYRFHSRELALFLLSSGSQTGRRSGLTTAEVEGKVLRATHALWVDDDGDCQVRRHFFSSHACTLLKSGFALTSAPPRRTPISTTWTTRRRARGTVASFAARIRSA